jgi:hypothetical protein
LQNANPRSQDNGCEATPCSAVTRILMGQGFWAQRGREGERVQRITRTAEIEPGANVDIGHSDPSVLVSRNECW